MNDEENFKIKKQRNEYYTSFKIAFIYFIFGGL